MGMMDIWDMGIDFLVRVETRFLTQYNMKVVASYTVIHVSKSMAGVSYRR